MTWLTQAGGLTYHENGEQVGRIEGWREFKRDGTVTVHQVAKRVGGSIRHALPRGDRKALCGEQPTGNHGTRGTWSGYKNESEYGVTCPKCQKLEPTPAADLTLAEVLERCIDP